LAIALEHKKVRLTDVFEIGGRYRVNERYTITDDETFKTLTPRGIIMHSSNIGIAKLVGSYLVTGI